MSKEGGKSTFRKRIFERDSLQAELGNRKRREARENHPVRNNEGSKEPRSIGKRVDFQPQRRGRKNSSGASPKPRAEAGKRKLVGVSSQMEDLPTERISAKTAFPAYWDGLAAEVSTKYGNNDGNAKRVFERTGLRGPRSQGTESRTDQRAPSTHWRIMKKKSLGEGEKPRGVNTLERIT